MVMILYYTLLKHKYDCVVYMYCTYTIVHRMHHNINVYTALTYIYKACKESLREEDREIALCVSKPLGSISDSIYFISICEHKENFSSNYKRILMESIIDEINELNQDYGTYINIVYDKNLEVPLSVDSRNVDSTRIGVIVNLGDTVMLYN